MTDNELAAIIGRDLSGSVGHHPSVSSIAEENNVSEDRVLKICGEIGVENCAICGWWTFPAEAVECDGEMICPECDEDEE